jgi:hypothetical protein
MIKKQKDKPAQTISIDDTEHKVADLTSEQISCINHIQDLDRKINSSQFNLDQLNFGRQAFANALNKSLEEVANA